jgi:hypothetical protein
MSNDVNEANERFFSPSAAERHFGPLKEHQVAASDG